jgi:hypothetical protein
MVNYKVPRSRGKDNATDIAVIIAILAIMFVILVVWVLL